MTAVLVAFAYYALLFLGAMALLGLAALAVYAVTWLYVYVMDRVLIAKKAHEVFLELLRVRLREERKAKE